MQTKQFSWHCSLFWMENKIFNNISASILVQWKTSTGVCVCKLHIIGAWGTYFFVYFCIFLLSTKTGQKLIIYFPMEKILRSFWNNKSKVDKYLEYIECGRRIFCCLLCLILRMELLSIPIKFFGQMFTTFLGHWWNMQGRKALLVICFDILVIQHEICIHMEQIYDAVETLETHFHF